ncbi:MAG TPA: AI-2E family transporter [Bryobacteraceae bacterium]|jgi:predicted PurR-regulated permease PerM|nr:AI-2E family transporter [Bryobacteraceae bacterium]
MLGIDERALRILWTIFLFGMLIALVYFLRSTLMIFALAIFFAYMLSPIVVFVERLLPKRRNIALAVVYFGLVGVLVLISFELVPAIGEQAKSLATRLPSLLSADKLASVPLPQFLRPFQDQLVSGVRSYMDNLQQHLVVFIRGAGSQIVTSLGALLPAILIPILAFFFMKDSEAIRVNLIGSVQDGHDRGLLEQIIEDVHSVLKNYIHALVLLAAAAFVCWVCFLIVMKYPYELLLAGCAAAGEFIPVIGPSAALIIMIVVSVVTGSGGILWLIVFWGVYRVFADYVLNPYLMSSGIELHPLLILFGVLAGETLGGIAGMFFSIPVIAILRVLYLNLRRAYLLRQLAVGVRTEPRAAGPEPIPTKVIIEPSTPS